MVTNKEKGLWLMTTMDIYASEIFGEFGYDTCSKEQQEQIMTSIFEDGQLD